ncbi:hypothetical protein [Roseateles chitinivorans]|uniref:hypothetical protein n=1 Tax=Roseateles chitinivorans TaxID=2917965 RepID=UPI0013045037|nr:hypothetical protein [Roseateles chitinivorans]
MAWRIASGRDPVDPALRAPLLGRLAWARQFLAPSRRDKLQRLFDAISFGSPPPAPPAAA